MAVKPTGNCLFFLVFIITSFVVDRGIISKVYNHVNQYLGNTYLKVLGKDFKFPLTGLSKYSIIQNVNLNINNFENTENKGNRAALSQATRTMVFEKDAYRCVNCGEYRLLEVDHIVPVCKGGGNEFENLQTLCATCNSNKGTLSMDEWINSIK